MTIVKCTNIKKYFGLLRRAVDGVSLEIEKGSSFGLVGESGSGKTTLGKILLGILRPDSGSLDITTDKRQVIFQDPYDSLDPKMKVFDILAEGLVIKKEFAGLKERICRSLDMVRLPKSALKKYPHQFSCGERQRIAIGRAILTDPEFIVCDEPVSSLDVTIQLQILRLLKEIQKTMSITYLLISHDLRVIRFMCDRVAVMREGRIVEEGDLSKVYSSPSHPYTKTLLSSILDIYPANNVINK